MSIVVNEDTEGLPCHKITFPEGATYTDVPRPTSEGNTPDPYAYFDAALASRRALTVTSYAHQRKYPLDSIDVTVEHDGTQERQGCYRPRAVLTLHDDLTDERRADLLCAVDKCPVHKLMTKAEINVNAKPAEHT